jgi:hypothetical protein
MNSCKDCVWWTKLPASVNQPIGSPSQGECRGAPPCVIAIPTPVKTPMGVQMKVQVSSAFPITPPEESCASFKGHIKLGE